MRKWRGRGAYSGRVEGHDMEWEKFMVWKERRTWCGKGDGDEEEKRKDVNCSNMSFLNLSQDVVWKRRGTRGRRGEGHVWKEKKEHGNCSVPTCQTQISYTCAI